MDARALSGEKRTVNVRQLLADLDQLRRERGSQALEPVSDERKEAGLTLETLKIDEETAYLLDAQVMKVGKYRGRTFAYIAKDFNYSRWVLKQRFAGGALGRFRTFLEENRTRLIEQQMQEALAATGTLSKRVKQWNREVMMDRGILVAAPYVGNATFHGSRRPRQPLASLETAGVLPPWNSKWTKLEKRNTKSLLGLSARTLNYLFRWMVHVVRGEPITERLVADKALEVIGTNDYAYRVALKLAGNDPDGEVTGEAMQNALDERRARCRSATKRATLPTTFNLSRIGPKDSITPRRILLRYMLSMRELRDALVLYRQLGKEDIATRWGELVAACWVLARSDGAFLWNRVSNSPCPEKLKDPGLPVVHYMRRAVDRWFVGGGGGAGGGERKAVNYAPCVGFTGGCPVEADLVVGDTVFAIRGSLWVSSSYDSAYLSGYAALSRGLGGPTINRIVMVFLQHETTLTLDLTDWDHVPLLDFLQANDGEELKAEGGNACDLGLCDQDENVPFALDVDEEAQAIKKLERKAKRRVERQGKQAGIKPMPSMRQRDWAMNGRTTRDMADKAVTERREKEEEQKEALAAGERWVQPPEREKKRK